MADKQNTIMKLQAPEYITSITPYPPGKPMEELERELGINRPIKLASNENPLGSSPMAIKAINLALELDGLHRYPDGSGFNLSKKLADMLEVPQDNIVLGNGSDDIITILTRAFLKNNDEAVISESSFLMYEISVRSCGAKPVFVPLKSFAQDLDAIAKAITPKTRIVFLTNPHNPTGSIIKAEDFTDFLDRIPSDVITVMDEAYIEFATATDSINSIDLVKAGKPIVVLRTFSKAYGLAGLRIGYGVMPGMITSILERIRPPFNTGILAQAGAIAALEDKPFLQKTLKLVKKEISFLYSELDILKLDYIPTQANFFLIKTGNAKQIFDALLKEGVIVRSMASYGFEDYIRINVGLHEENVRFIKTLEKVMKNG